MIRFLILIVLSFILSNSFSQNISENTDSSSFYKQRTKHYIKEEKKLKYSNPQKKILFDSIAYFYKKSPDDTLLYYYNLANINWQYKVYHNYDLLINKVNQNLGISLKMSNAKGVDLSYKILTKIYKTTGQSDSCLRYSSLYHNFLMKQVLNDTNVSDKLYIKIGINLEYLAESYANLHNYDLALFFLF